VVVAVPELEPVLVGNAVAVTEEYVPVAEVALHCSGRDFAPDEPQDAGTTPLRLAYAVKNAAYDHVKSAALSGLPSDLEYCSARAPLEGVYFCAMLMYPSA
jgi:hypothetical protein